MPVGKINWLSYRGYTPVGGQLPHPYFSKSTETQTTALTEREEQLDRIEEKLDQLNRRLDLIFGDHALVNGRFINLRGT